MPQPLNAADMICTLLGLRLNLSSICHVSASLSPPCIERQVYSTVGRTRTIPRANDDIARWRIAFFGCSNLPTAFFTSYGYVTCTPVSPQTATTDSWRPSLASSH